MNTAMNGRKSTPRRKRRVNWRGVGMVLVVLMAGAFVAFTIALIVTTIITAPIP